MMSNYHHLTYDQRRQIYTLKSRGDSNACVAIALNVDPGTICRELKRNKDQKGYRFKQANENQLPEEILSLIKNLQKQ